MSNDGQSFSPKEKGASAFAVTPRAKRIAFCCTEGHKSRQVRNSPTVALLTSMGESDWMPSISIEPSEGAMMSMPRSVSLTGFRSSIIHVKMPVVGAKKTGHRSWSVGMFAT